MIFFRAIFFLFVLSSCGKKASLPPALVSFHERGHLVSTAAVWPSRTPLIPYKATRFRYIGPGSRVQWKIFEQLKDGSLRVPFWINAGDPWDPVFFKNPNKEEMILKGPRVDWSEKADYLDLRLGPDVQAYVIEAVDDQGQAVRALVDINLPLPFEFPQSRLFEYQYGLGSHVLTDLQKPNRPNMKDRVYARRYLSGILAPESWSVQKNCSRKGVIVLDGGFFQHSSLRFVGGYNAANPSSYLLDGKPHGTHVSGIIAGLHQSSGAWGVCDEAGIFPIQIIDSKTGYASDKSFYEGLRVASEQNAFAGLNLSVGALSYFKRNLSDALDKEAFAYFQSLERMFESVLLTLEKKRVVMAIAAGNQRVNVDVWTTFYLELGLRKNAILVAATNQKGEIASFSNYGMNTVDVAAPGEDILSTIPGDAFGAMSGTSMATPFVSGLALLIANRYEDLSAEQIKIRINLTSDYQKELDSYVRFGLINAYRAMVSEFDPVEGNTAEYFVR